MGGKLPSAHAAYRPEIDGLRAIAVSSVLLFHAFPGILKGGFAGVDIFFVISGYLISGILLKDLDGCRFSYLTFYARRARRLLPALLTVLSATSAAAWAFLYPSEFCDFGKQLLYGAGFLANIGHLNEFGGYFGAHSDEKGLLHLWSLGVEEQFYLIWPLVLTLAYWFSRQSLSWFLAAGIALSLFLSAYLCSLHPDDAFYYPHTRMWELGLGAALALAERRLGAGALVDWILPETWEPDRIRARSWMGGAGLALLAGSLIGISATHAIPGLWMLPATIGTTLVLGAGPAAWVNARFLASKPFIYVGTISYPLYLWHWPLLVFARLLCKEPSRLLLLAALVFAVVLADLTCRLLEAPIRKLSERSTVVAGMAVGLVGLALLGAIVKMGALHGRIYSAALVNLESARQDWRFVDRNFLKADGFSIVQTPSKPTHPAVTLFIGDSHAQQYYPRVQWLTEQAKPDTRQVRFATSGGCPALPRLNRDSARYHCDEFEKFAFEQAQRPEVDTVVYVAFWDGYFLGSFQSNPPRDLRVISASDVSHRAIVPGSLTFNLVLKEFEAEVKQLQRTGKTVFIVLPNPVSSHLDPQWLFPERATREGGSLSHTPFAASVKRSEYEDFAEPVVREFEALALRNNVRIINPLDALCVGFTCGAWSNNGTFMYRDSDHLNAAGALELGAFLDVTVVRP